MEARLSKVIWPMMALVCPLLFATYAFSEIEFQQLPSASWIGSFQNGSSHSTPSEDCNHHAMAEEIRLAGGDTPADIGRRVNEKLRQCDPQLLKNISPIEATDYITVKYPLDQSEQVRKVILTLPNGRKITGSLGFQDTDEPRPLMVVRCGLLCKADNTFSSNTVIMRFLEEGPFHVLMLENTSSSVYIANNQAFSIGGFMGGKELLEALSYISQSQFADRFSSYHIHGISMGGSDAFMAAVYASQNPGRFPKISSVSMICPVLDVERSIETSYQRFIASGVAQIMTLSTVLQIYDEIDYLSQNYTRSEIRRMNPRQLQRLVSEAAVDQARQASQDGWGLAPFKGDVIDTKYEFFQANRMPDLQKYVTIPTYVFHARNDRVILDSANFSRLEGSLEASPNPHIATVALSRGDHCGYGVAYGWNVFSSLQRELILRHVPELETRSEAYPMNFLSEDRQAINLDPSEAIARYSFHHRPGSAKIGLKFRIFSPVRPGSSRQQRQRSRRCSRHDAATAPSSCYRTSSMDLELSQLGLNATDYNTSQTSNKLERQLNVRAKLVSQGGHTVIGQSQLPDMILLESEALHDPAQVLAD